ncbi:prostate and testis expressed 1 [Rhinolophus ferrumequinum]|uniref:Prostate and testis expressed 1 n=1 Tax=Rhinolophus ferrumequinum TaxID=59479 RepID=A0A7J7RQ38_RHIFE|nr:prostate and testis expressed 1 [Rhinolophus ferrumequinum]
MDKPLLLGLPILLCCFRVLSGSFSDQEQTKIIQCRMCHVQFPGEKCSRGRGICTATADEACTIGRIFKNDGTLWLTFLGCLKNCANVNRIKWNTYFVNLRCCRSDDLCNELVDA